MDYRGKDPLVDQATLIIVFYCVAVAVGIVAILKFIKNKTKRVSSLRLFVQVAALLFVFMGLLVGPFNVQGWTSLGSAPRDNLIGGGVDGVLGSQFPDGISVPFLACYYPSGRTVTCPIWQLQAYIFPFWDANTRGYAVYYSTSGIEKLAIVVGSLIVMVVALGRFWCGWICPVGFYMDVLTRLRKATGKRHLSFSKWGNDKLRQFSYIIIAVFLLLSVIFGSQAIFGTQIVPGTIVGGPQGTEAGITGYLNEPFCLVCPVRPLCVLAEVGLGTMKSSYVFAIYAENSFWTLGFYVTSINLSILILITVLSLAYRRFWCRICPLGAISAIFSAHKPFKQIALTKLQKDEEKCTKCGVCKRVCPTQATDMYEAKNGDVTESNCILCARCVEMCPYEGALRIEFAGKTVMKSRNWLGASVAKDSLD